MLLTSLPDEDHAAFDFLEDVVFVPGPPIAADGRLLGIRVVGLLIGHAAIIRKRQPGSFGNGKTTRENGHPVRRSERQAITIPRPPICMRFGRGRRLRPREVKGAGR